MRSLFESPNWPRRTPSVPCSPTGSRHYEEFLFLYFIIYVNPVIMSIATQTAQAACLSAVSNIIAQCLAARNAKVMHTPPQDKANSPGTSINRRGAACEIHHLRCTQHATQLSMAGVS